MRAPTRGSLRPPGGPLPAAARLVKSMPWPRIASRLVAKIRAGQNLLLLSDYDGTLTPIVRDPSDAWLSHDVRADIGILAASGRVRVGILSGRALDDLRLRVGVEGVLYAGCHGLEVEGPTMRFQHPAADERRTMLASLATTLSERTAELGGVVVESKGLAVAVHYRNASLAEQARLLTVLRGTLGSRVDLRSLHGRKVVEILPTQTWDKGRCAVWIRDHVLRASTPHVTTVYMGDDATDEPAFRALRGDALTIKVGGSGPTLAACALAGVDGVHRLLSALAAEVDERRPQPA